MEPMKHRRFRVSHRHRHNPRFVGYTSHRRRRHHNPFDQHTMLTAAWALGGGVAATWLPGVVVPTMTGWAGVLATGVSAVAIGWVGDKFAGPVAGTGLLIGGLVATGGKLIAQLMGKQLVSFGMGQYTQTWFGPPYNSSGILQTTPNPYTPPPAAAPGGGGASSTHAAMSGLLGRATKFRSKFAR